MIRVIDLEAKIYAIKLEVNTHYRPMYETNLLIKERIRLKEQLYLIRCKIHSRKYTILEILK